MFKYRWGFEKLEQFIQPSSVNYVHSIIEPSSLFVGIPIYQTKRVPDEQ